MLVSILDKSTLAATQSVTLADGLNFQSGLRVETDCQTCNYTQLRMNGLGGAYSQILINNRPVFNALMGLYGLEQLPVNMIEKVEIVKGGGSAIYGSNAIAGTVNVITRQPEKDHVGLELNTALINGQVWDHRLNVNATKVLKDAGLTLFASARDRSPYDHNGDGFSELPLIRNNSFGLNTYIKPGNKIKIGIDFTSLTEKRRGGNKIDQPPHHADHAEERFHSIKAGGIDFEWIVPTIKSNLNSYMAFQNTIRDHYTGIDGVDAYGNTSSQTFVGGIQANTYFKNTTITTGIEYKYDDIYDVIPFYNFKIDQRTHQLGIFTQAD